MIISHVAIENYKLHHVMFRLPELDLRGLGRCLRQDRPVAATFADRHHRAEDKALG